MRLRLAVCAAMGAARLVELVYSRRNIAGAGSVREGAWSRRTYPAIVALHITVIGGTAFAGERKANPAWLGLLVALQPMRAWVIATLGRRWNTRAAVAQDQEVATGGPYAFVRHPNYTVVFLELLALPIAFGVTRVALTAAAVHAALLAIRVRDEEALLMESAAYRAYARGRARFIPGLF